MKLAVLKNNLPISELIVPTENILDGHEIFVGRSEDCHIIIDDPLISRHHFLIYFRSSNWYLKRLSELGVVSVNGQIGAEILLRNGDAITFGIYSIYIGDINQQQQNPSSLEIQPLQQLVDEEILIPEDLLSEETIVNPIEELDATTMMGDNAPGAEDIIGAPIEGDSASDEISIDADQLDGMDFDEGLAAVGGEANSGETDVLAPEENVENTNDEGTEAIEGNLDFGGDQTGAISSEADGESSEDSTRVVRGFATFELLLFGDYVPYDKYLLDRDEVFIGRDANKCQIILNDTEVSSVHAVVRKQSGLVVVEDLNSSNGTLVGGQRINKAELSNNDEFIIGNTTFTVHVASDLLRDELDRLMPVESHQVIEREEIIEEEVPMSDDGVGNIDFASTEAPKQKSLFLKLKDPKNRPRVLIGAVLIGLVFLLMSEDEGNKRSGAEEKKVEPVAKTAGSADANKKILTKEEIQYLQAIFKLAESYVLEQKLDLALAELEKIIKIDPNFNKVQSLYATIKRKNQQLKEDQERIKAEALKAQVREEVKALVEQARQAVRDHNQLLAENLFSQITQKDPENLEVNTLKLELEGYLQEQRRLAEEKARKEAERKRMVDALSPGKTNYLKKEWFRAILKLEEFLRQKGMDEDLVKDASDMLTDSKTSLAAELAPILGKARSFKEGQDLKGAYEAYNDVIKIDPTNGEALSEVDSIKEQLDLRSKKVYRDAIIAESLSLFQDAKEKLQEVQQMSPSDSEYYKKATEKLKNYLE